MENREIVVANTRNQKKYKIITNATTKGELIAAFNANENVTVLQNGQWVTNTEPIDYNGLDFMEGISKVALLDDASPLPETVMYKGQPTSNLVILLTNSKKNIASGALEDYKRSDLYDIIRSEGDSLKCDIADYFDKHYTNVSTAELYDYLVDHEYIDEEDDFEEDCDTQEIADNIYNTIKSLVYCNVFGREELFSIIQRTGNLADSIDGETEKSNVNITFGDNVISENDIDNMVNSLT